jgi:LacI family transcriptional regulator
VATLSCLRKHRADEKRKISRLDSWRGAGGGPSTRSQDEPGREPELLRTLAAQVDVLIAYLFQPDDVVAAATEGAPLVVLSRRPDDPSFGAVDIDVETGIRAAVRHLAAHGHRRIGMLDCTVVHYHRRLASFLTETARAGLTVPDGAVVDVDPPPARCEVWFPARWPRSVHR